MAIKFACPTCQHAFKTDEKFAGRQATCPSCQNTLTIPALPEPELVPAADRLVAHTPKLSQPAPEPRPFAAEELSEEFNPFASPHAEDTRPSFAGMYQQLAELVQLEYGGFFSRWVAMILDGLITGVIRVVMLIGLVFGTVAFLGARAVDEENPVMMAIGILFYVIWLGVPWLYEAFMVSSDKHATLGKMALGLKVTNLAGNPIGFGQASGRHFGKLASGLLFGLGFFMQAFDPKGQALHDKLAGCLVIRSR